MVSLPGVTKEQIEKAREWDLLSYLQTYEPHELKRSSPNEYCTRTHDSLKISNGKWCWNSRGFGGRTALDYLIKVRGMLGMERLELAIREDPELSRRMEPIYHNPPPAEHGKDYNEFLISLKKDLHKKRTRQINSDLAEY